MHISIKRERRFALKIGLLAFYIFWGLSVDVFVFGLFNIIYINIIYFKFDIIQIISL